MCVLIKQLVLSQVLLDSGRVCPAISVLLICVSLLRMTIRVFRIGALILVTIFARPILLKGLAHIEHLAPRMYINGNKLQPREWIADDMVSVAGAVPIANDRKDQDPALNYCGSSQFQESTWVAREHPVYEFVFDWLQVDPEFICWVERHQVHIAQTHRHLYHKWNQHPVGCQFLADCIARGVQLI